MKTKILFLLTITTIFYSCSNSDDNSNNSIDSSKLIGKWSLVSEKETANGTTVFEADWDHNCSTTNDYVEFYNNGEFDWIEYQLDCNINTASSNTDATWTLSGNTINFGNDPELESAKIESLTETTLILKDEFSEGGVNYVYYTTFQKQ